MSPAGSTIAELLAAADPPDAQGPTGLLSVAGDHSLDVARALISEGSHVFVASANPQFTAEPPAKPDREFDFPTGWTTDSPAVSHLKPWRAKQRQALYMRTGGLFDCPDVDVKHGAVVDVQRERLQTLGIVIYGESETPTGGAHFYVISTGLKSGASRAGGVDWQARGKGVYLPGTQRPYYRNTTCDTYRWVQPLDIARALDDRQSADFMAEQEQAIRAYLLGMGIVPAAADGSVAAGEVFMAERLKIDVVKLQSAVPTVWNAICDKAGWEVGRRSEQFHFIVCEAHRHNVPLGEVLTLMHAWNEHSQKYVGRSDVEVMRSWEKAKADEAKKAAAANSSPVAAVTAVGGGTDAQGLIDAVGAADWLEQGPAVDRPSTWALIDEQTKVSFLDGTYEPIEPTIGLMDNGRYLFYRGETHTIAGDSGSGKSLIAQCLCVEVMSAGERVLYLDFESRPAAVTQRMMELGSTREQYLTLFDYAGKVESGLLATADREQFRYLLTREYALCIIDGYSAAERLLIPGTADLDVKAGQFHELLPQRIAARTGAAVIMVDHVTKSRVGRNGYQVGSFNKKGVLGGTLLLVEPEVKPRKSTAGQPARGTVRGWLAKDRPGGVSPHMPDEETRGLHEGTQNAGLFTFTARADGTTQMHICAPLNGDQVAAEQARWAAEHARACRDRIMWLLTDSPMAPGISEDGLTVGEVRQACGKQSDGSPGFRAGDVTMQLGQLIADGLVEMSKGSRGSKMHKAIRPAESVESLEQVSDQLEL
jgi:AAA domain